MNFILLSLYIITNNLINQLRKIMAKEPCRNCKSEIESKIRRCPYCGILNPTVKIKDIFIGIFFVLVVMYIVTYFMNG